jgi:hypothetical protein
MVDLGYSDCMEDTSKEVPQFAAAGLSALVLALRQTCELASVPAFALVVGLSLSPVASASPADQVQAGNYEDTDGSGSYLEISTADQGNLVFQLVSNGANGHSCSVAGTIEGTRGQSGSANGLPNCVVDFHAMPNSIEVRVGSLDGNFEACRSYCGMRAGFEGTYSATPAGCSRTERQATYRSSAQAEKDHDYGRSFEGLRRVQADCQPFLGWIENDAVHNHLALALHHLDRNDECLKELDTTLASSAGNERSLRDNFEGQPMSFDAYLPTAKTTWHIRELCTGGQPKAP